ncbi:MAG: hypothetical protein K6T59_13790, partial [Bryobacteraceae bacterium]|nr:hypothetical protein [Bryobacteraceae bacterium]
KTKAAVRSSASVEDSATASFAGQYHTQLRVADAKAGLKAIRQCWASLFSEHATAYSNVRAKGGPQARMAVIVQEMIEPVFAGVAFTREPVTGSMDVSYAEWVAGVGEALVSGKSLDGRVWLSRDGKILQADYLRGDDVPKPSVWRELIDELKRVEQVLGPSQDVEWGWTGRKIVLIQARPDTHTPRGERTDGAPPRWILPGRPAGGWTDEQLRLFNCWDEYNPPVVHPLDFHLYMAAIWQASLDMLDFGQGVPQIEQVVVLQDEVPLMIDPAARVEPSGRKYPRGKCAPDFEYAMARVGERVRDLERAAINLAKLPDNQLLQLINKTATVYRDIQVTRLLKGMDLWIEGEKQAKKTLRRILRRLDVDVEKCIEVLESGVDHETARMNRSLRELAATAAREGKTGTWYQMLDRFIAEFGHFESNGILLCQSRNIIEAQVDRMVEAERHSTSVTDPRERSDALVKELLLRLANTKKQGEFRDAVAALRHWVALRENSKMRPELPRPLLQCLQEEAGKRLVQCRLLSNAEDVRLLTPSELRSAFESRAVERDTLIRRGALVNWKARHPSWLPTGFLGQSCGPNDRVLFGISGSPGVATGPARCVRGPDEFGAVRAGDVVIARSTNPVWTQLFSRIAAIVVENGSRLSHAAVVAREVGIPAVVGIPGVFDAVRDGEQLRVDGTAGEVIRLDSKKEG